jgi:hypothetical protein
MRLMTLTSEINMPMLGMALADLALGVGCHFGANRHPKTAVPSGAEVRQFRGRKA